MSIEAGENAKIVAAYVAGAMDRKLPLDVMDAGRMCLADWLAVGIGAHDQGAGITVRETVKAWSSSGTSPVMQGGESAAMVSALVNGTFAHCLDYDDTHVGCLAHLSGPTWAATLAVAAENGASDQQTLKAFVTGFEVGARLGGKGFGEAVNKLGIHSTAVFGRLAATAAAGALLGLNEDQMISALGVAATQAGGLVASFGTMSKPFHAGKAAMDGVLSAQMASNGFEAAGGLLEVAGDGLARVLVQGGQTDIGVMDFNDGWEILENTFKPYAACLLTHPVIDSARELHNKLNGREAREIRAHVNPMVLRFAAKANPKTPLEGKFSTTYCTALGLCGYRGSERDFSPARLSDPGVLATMDRVHLVSDETLSATAAKVTIDLADGGEISAETPLATGNPGNPLGWDGINWKFMSLVEPVLGDDAAALFDHARHFGDGDDLRQISRTIAAVH